MRYDPLVRENLGAIKAIAARHGARNLRIFGSRARGEASPASDIDLLIEAGPEHSFFFPGGLIAELEELLGCRVEVITERALRPELREQVLSEAVPL